MTLINHDENGRMKALSGERFRVGYLLRGNEEKAKFLASDICLEQTVEFPKDLLPGGPILSEIVGAIESFNPLGKDLYKVVISFAVETAGNDIAQLFNVIYGNISLKPGIRVESLYLPQEMLSRFPGPRFGREGLRLLCGVEDRPLSATALKPMGLSPKELADQAYKFALGGIDIIKDDHGLTDQVFCPFEERISRCAEAVELANLRTGMHSIYMANVTAGVDRARETAKRAKELGAKALLFCPSLVGFDTLRYLAEDNSLSLPIMVHPSFGGIYATSKDSGIGHGLLYGTIMRLLGADATIYPNFGGRFSFSKHECMDIAHAAGAALGDFPSIFPAPGGGMTPERTEEMLNVYGKDFIILVGAGLHRSGGNLTENAKYLSQMLSGLRG